MGQSRYIPAVLQARFLHPLYSLRKEAIDWMKALQRHYKSSHDGVNHNSLKPILIRLYVQLYSPTMTTSAQSLWRLCCTINNGRSKQGHLHWSKYRWCLLRYKKMGYEKMYWSTEVHRCHQQNNRTPWQTLARRTSWQLRRLIQYRQRTYCTRKTHWRTARIRLWLHCASCRKYNHARYIVNCGIYTLIDVASETLQ